MNKLSEQIFALNDNQNQINIYRWSLLRAGFNFFRHMGFEVYPPRMLYMNFFERYHSIPELLATVNGIVTGWHVTDMQQRTTMESYFDQLCVMAPRFPIVVVTESSYVSRKFEGHENIAVVSPDHSDGVGSILNLLVNS